jgi:hypothetical protein
VQNTRWWSWVTNVPELVVWLVLLVLSLFSAAPQQVQSLAVEVVFSVFVGALVGVHMLLYSVYPVLVVLPSVVCVGLGVLWRHWSVRSSAVVPEEVAGPPEGRATGELVSATEAHVLLQDMQEAMDNEDIYSVSSNSSEDGDKWSFSDNDNLSVSEDDE